MVKLTLPPTVSWLGSRSADKDRVDELNDTVLPAPVAAALFTVAPMSVPLEWLVVSELPNVPPVPSLMTFTERKAAVP